MSHKTNSDKHKSYEGLLGPQFFSCREAHGPSLRISGLERVLRPGLMTWPEASRAGASGRYAGRNMRTWSRGHCPVLGPLPPPGIWFDRFCA